LVETAPRSYIVLGQNIVTESVYQTPIQDRPVHDTLDGITRWLNGNARAETSFTRLIDNFGWRLIAAGFSLLRVSIHGGTLHPQFRSSAQLWWRDTGQTQKMMMTYEVADIIPYSENPVRRVREGGEILRHRLENKDGPFEFAVLAELQARGATDYFARPVLGPDHAARAAEGALSAGRETLEALKAYRVPEQGAPLRIVIALHYGTVIYGNIGAADRLDFTVIGPAVNLVSRAEAIAKSLDEPLVVTDEIATVLGSALRSLGRHRLRGLEKEHELFAPLGE